jgi:hypothetical protein
VSPAAKAPLTEAPAFGLGGPRNSAAAEARASARLRERGEKRALDFEAAETLAGMPLPTPAPERRTALRARLPGLRPVAPPAGVPLFAGAGLIQRRSSGDVPAPAPASALATAPRTRAPPTSAPRSRAPRGPPTAAADAGRLAAQRRRAGLMTQWVRAHRPAGLLTRARRARLAALVHVAAAEGGAAEAAVRRALGDDPDVSKAMRGLAAEGLLARSGGGGRSSPFRFSATAKGLAALAGARAELAADADARAALPSALPEELAGEASPSAQETEGGAPTACALEAAAEAAEEAAPQAEAAAA